VRSDPVTVYRTDTVRVMGRVDTVRVTMVVEREDTVMVMAAPMRASVGAAGLAVAAEVFQAFPGGQFGRSHSRGTGFLLPIEVGTARTGAIEFSLGYASFGSKSDGSVGCCNSLFQIGSALVKSLDLASSRVYLGAGPSYLVSSASQDSVLPRLAITALLGFEPATIRRAPLSIELRTTYARSGFRFVTAGVRVPAP
jgi:hypothetical protein